MATLLLAKSYFRGKRYLGSQVYNMDESGMPLDHKPPKVLARKGTKKIHCTSGNEVQINVIACANAAGSTLMDILIKIGVRGKFLTPFTECQTNNFFYWMTTLC